MAIQTPSTQLLKVMVKKREVVLLTVSGLLQLAMMVILCDRSPSRDMQVLMLLETAPFPPRPAASATRGAWYRQQRNIMSRELNRVKQEYAKITCQAMGMRRKLGRADVEHQVLPNVSEKEGLYFNPCEVEGWLHVLDIGLATWLSNFLAGEHVASFGEGPGVYKWVIDQTGKLKAYDAYDWGPYCTDDTQNRVKFLDLTAPQYGLPLYDWVVILVMPKHIPNKYEAVVLDNIVRHARKGVILNWLVPGEGGLAGNVELALKDRGFLHNPRDSQALRNAATMPWLKTNTSVFRRTGVEAQADEA